MKIKRELFVIGAGGRHDDGTKIEPEEQVTQHIYESEADVTHGGASTGGGIPMQIIAHGTAGEVADNLARTCDRCKHFDRARWHHIIDDAEGPLGTAEKRHAINEARAAILMSANATVVEAHMHEDGDIDVEHCLKSMGICRALTEHEKQLVPVHPLASCPLEYVTPALPNAFFKPKDSEARKAAAQSRDLVLRRAQGKLS